MFAYRGRTLDEWKATLTAADAETRRKAFLALWGSHGPGPEAKPLAPILLELTSHSDTLTRRRARNSLKSMGVSATRQLPSLIQSLKTADGSEAHEVLQDLAGRAGTPPDPERFLAVLKYRTAPVVERSATT